MTAISNSNLYKRIDNSGGWSPCLRVCARKLLLAIVSLIVHSPRSISLINEARNSRGLHSVTFHHITISS